MLFKALVKAFYDGNFEETVTALINNPSYEKEHIKRVLASLCGTDLDYMSGDFAAELREKMLSASKDYKTVTKIKPCSMECTTPGSKTACQGACPFEAINIDEENHTTYINNERCIGCGFCIEACPNHNFMDKVEFFPLAKSL